MSSPYQTARIDAVIPPWVALVARRLQTAQASRSRGTDLCEAPHFQYHVQGVLHMVMTDGSEFDARPGDVTALPQGHDAWVVGDEPVVVLDWYGASNYARS
jgi:hypothetical protein